MNIEDVDEVQAQIILDLWECCGEAVAIVALHYADNDGWTRFDAAFVWAGTPEGHAYWGDIDSSITLWRKTHGR